MEPYYLYIFYSLVDRKNGLNEKKTTKSKNYVLCLELKGSSKMNRRVGLK